ncbi:beta galactosidase jelly roll domain-containing protein [Marinifilum sp.]|uniref:beta galactosidase jelly roll domain-containing protein n=1 Tax=Marinifilum sp. TaxID=2033137 RepID=UPI003BAAEEFF
MNNRKNILALFRISLITLLIVTSVGNAFAKELKSLVNLKGYWKFTIGDDPNWASPQYNDSEWEKVFVPKSWEGNGFSNYNGYAWYRKNFSITIPKSVSYVYLNIGYIDDADEVYVNGKLLGASGVMGPVSQTAYNIPRMYPVPKEILNQEGENLIAVRVYDDYRDGGIVGGNINITFDADQHKMNVDLSGYWDFETSKEISENHKKVITQKEGKIFVPGFWEARGYSFLDGKAIYSKRFVYPIHLSTQNQVLFAGYIDDIDEVYLNGEKIGGILDLKRKRRSYSHISANYILRAYEIPDKLLIKGHENYIEIIVRDHGGPGGIYNGPIGIIGKESAQKIRNKSIKDSRSPFQKFLDYWFD